MKAPNSTDKYVGSRVRMRRLMLGMSQEALGDALGLTFQQVQKYEKGSNRIGASRLHHIAQILGVPESLFFEGGPSGVGNALPDYVSEFLASTDGLTLAKCFTSIKSAKVRRSLVKLVQEILEQLEASAGIV